MLNVSVTVFASGSWDTRLLQPPTTTEVICDVVVAKQVVLFQYCDPFLGFRMRSDLGYHPILRFRCNCIFDKYFLFCNVISVRITTVNR